MNFLNWLNSQKYRVLLLSKTGDHSPGEVLEITSFADRVYGAPQAVVRTVGKLEGTDGYIEIPDGNTWKCSTEYISLPINLKNISREITPSFLLDLIAEKGSEPTVIYKEKKLQVAKLVAIFMGVSIGDSLTIFRSEDNLYIAKLPSGLADLGVQLQSDYSLHVDLDHVFKHNDKFTVAFGNSLEASNYGNVIGFKLVNEGTGEIVKHLSASEMPTPLPNGVYTGLDDDDDDDDEDYDDYDF